MRRSIWSVLAAAAVLAACGGSAVSIQLGTVSDGPVIAAANLAFDRAELEVPADMAFSLLVENRESAPHNVAVYGDDSGHSPVFVGEIFGGPGSRQYELPALPAGTYFFRCDVHPDMKGTLVATRP